MKNGLKTAAFAFLTLAYPLHAQEYKTIPEEILKGSNTIYRNFWDVKKYDISVESNFEAKSLEGVNTFTIEILKNVKKPTFQIDLQQPMDFEIIPNNHQFKAIRHDDFIFITSDKNLKKGETLTFSIKFKGKPRQAKNAPWDGGWVFKKDKQGYPWISVAQEGDGASLWLPIKDIWSDEPDHGITLKIITEKGSVGVGNGRLMKKNELQNKAEWIWEVKNPINDYSIVPTIGNLVNFKDSYAGEKGVLDLDYWVLEENLEKAKTHFQQTKLMLKAFEYWFGPYPFYEDSFKLVETPYLGMEHQSNIAYGNKYKNGYLGMDMSGSGYGKDWDYIIVHEAGHEWFANNITAKDQADMWIHESFTTYSEVLYVDFHKGTEAGNLYAQGLRRNILNDRPIIGEYGKRNEGSGDMYSKGANIIHTIRQMTSDDERFRKMLREMNIKFRHQTVTTEDIINFMSKSLNLELNSLVDQYLKTTKIPTLEYQQIGNKLKFRYNNTVENFKMPIKVNNGTITLNPTLEWQTITLQTETPLHINPNYYVNYKLLP